VRSANAAPEVKADVIQPSFPYTNGYGGENGNGHVLPVENNGIEDGKCRTVTKIQSHLYAIPEVN